MTRDDKTAAIAELREELGATPFFYLADSSTLSVAKINKFRRMCFEQGITVKVAKNTLIQKALEGAPESKGYQPLFEALSGPTTIIFSGASLMGATGIGPLPGLERRSSAWTRSSSSRGEKGLVM